MSDNDGRDRPGQDRQRNPFLQTESRAASAARAATSPRAVEATLTSISDEVMEEAVARRERDAASSGFKKP